MTAQDILRVLSANSATGELVFQGNNTEVSLFFSQGEIVHAIGPGVTGEQAVFAALAIASGTCAVRQPSELPKVRTVPSRAQCLILDALHQIDDGRAGPGKGEP